MAYKLVIVNGSETMEPVVVGQPTWETQRTGGPGVLKFKVLHDKDLNFQEGNAVKFYKGETKVFFGFVFTKSRSKDNIISVTAYDQLRYFKNKDTYVYENKTASELIKILTHDFNLQAGEIEDTVHKIESRIEKDKTLFDMVGNALDITLESKRQMYVLYDDFGKLTLKNIESMKLDILLDEETGEDLNYTSSIDETTSNQIKLTFDNEKTGKREVYMAKDTGNINNWGVLQYYESMEDSKNGQVKADALLKLYNKKFRSLSLKNVFGDIRVRGGSLIAVALDLGDIKVKNNMIVEKVQHTFDNDEHWMDVTLRGGDING